ncbi:hypothetical protein JCM10213_001558 [Rhodosporidiobolus nylandii]
MPPKRPQQPGEQTGAQKKRQRMREQRTIPVERGRAGGSAASGNKGLPPTIEVEKFAQARSFEISAMQRSMRSAKAAATLRAFQSLPRSLRRRAASHNIRRLPLRLRKRARGEVPKDAAKPKKVSRGMLGKRWWKRRGVKAEMWAKRQEKKIWLETHVWHAKRMHMTEIWGHRLALTPTAKAFRSSHRATQHGCLLHDASYYQYLELRGPFDALVAVLERVCDSAGRKVWGGRYSTGAREVTTDLYDPSLSPYPRGLLGPATFLWRPSPSSSPSSEPRTLLLRLHPSLAAPALRALRSALASSPPSIASSVLLTPLEKAYATFELTGEKAGEVLGKVLRPVKGTGRGVRRWVREEMRKGPAAVGEGMCVGMEVYDPRLSFPPKLPSPSPASSAAPEDEDDPLLPSANLADVPRFWDEEERGKASLGPRFTKRELDGRREENLIPGTPLTPIAQDDRIPVLITQRTLGVASRPSSSTSSPSSRSHTSSTSTSTSSPSSTATSISLPTAQSTPQHTFLLTLPHSFASAFWSSLVFSTPRIGGLTERSHSFREAGAARYPEDYVSTPGYEEFEARRESEERGYWERRPPAKRESYGKLGTREPWRVEMRGVCGEAWERHHSSEGKEQGGENEKESEGEEPFVVPYPVATALLASLSSPSSSSSAASTAPPPSTFRPAATTLFSSLSAAYSSLSPSSATATPSPAALALLRSALVRVRLTPLGRGKPEELALVYELEEREAEEVCRTLEGEKEGRKAGRAVGEGAGGGAEDGGMKQILPSTGLTPKQLRQRLIGRLTTGGFSMSTGEGAGVGVVTMERFLSLTLRSCVYVYLSLSEEREISKLTFSTPSPSSPSTAMASSSAPGVVLWRNRGSETFRAAVLSLMQ